MTIGKHTTGLKHTLAYPGSVILACIGSRSNQLWWLLIYNIYVIINALVVLYSRV